MRAWRQYIAELKAVPRAQGFDEVFYPGEIEARNNERNRREGLLLPDDTVADLTRIARETALDAQFAAAFMNSPPQAARIDSWQPPERVSRTRLQLEGSS